MTITESGVALVHAAAKAASTKAAQDAIAIDVSSKLPLADAFLIVSGSSERNVSAIADAIEDALLDYKVKPLRREGKDDGRWVLLDFGDLIAHIFHEDERSFYNIERLWSDCPVIELPENFPVADDEDA